MKIQTVTLEQVLSARDRRAQIQSNMLGREGADALVCLTLNIAGEIKRTVLTGLLFRRGTEAFDRLGLDVMEQQFLDGPAGSEAFWLVRGDAEEIKRKLEAVEESYPAARLFDFDVLVPNVPAENGGGIIPVKLSRATARSCLICGRPAAECARSRAHGLEAVREVTWDLLRGSCAQTLSDAAYDSLLDELYTTPKPGLVDLADCGAHTDMDVPLGCAIGNALEVQEALEVLHGGGPEDLREVSLRLAAEMLHTAHKGSSDACYSMAQKTLEDGSAYRVFENMVAAQGGDISFLSRLAAGDVQEKTASCEVKAEKDGYITEMDTDGIGMCSVMLRAGRAAKEDAIDYSAGILLHRKYGDFVRAGETIATLKAEDSELFAAAEERFLHACHIGPERPEKRRLIYGRVSADGVEML